MSNTLRVTDLNERFLILKIRISQAQAQISARDRLQDWLEVCSVD